MRVPVVLCLVLSCAASGQIIDINFFDFYHPVTVPETECQKHMNRYIDGLRQGELWAYQMFDASSKPSSGLLRGNIRDVGNFDECINIELQDANVGNIIGKHCTFGLKLTRDGSDAFKKLPTVELGPLKLQLLNLINSTIKVTEASIVLLLSVCLPLSCKPSDLQYYLPNMSSYFNISYDDSKCSSKFTWSELDGYDYALITVMSVVFLLVISSTIYELILNKKEKRARNEVYLSFSLISNTKNLLETNRNPDTITCLDGLRALSVMFIILSHRMYLQILVGLSDVVQVYEWLHEWYAFYLFEPLLYVDTFLFLGGTVLSYVFLKTMNRNGGKFNIIQFYLIRYIRLTPPVIMLVLVQVSVMRHLSNGPLYVEQIKPMVDSCLKWWWSVLLYTQNHFGQNEMCLGHMWYLSVDMQLYLLSPLILMPLWKSRKNGFYVIGALICASLVTGFSLLYFMELRLGTARYYEVYYIVTYTRAAPWLLGIIFGTILDKYKTTKINIHWTIHCITWPLIFIVMAFVSYSTNFVREAYTIMWNATLNTFNKVAWAICLAWIVFACNKGAGGIINSFLSMPLLQIIAKLSYSMYLLHITVIVFSLATNRDNLHWSGYTELTIGCGNLLITIVLSVFWVLLFEYPVAAIQTQLIKKHRDLEQDVENSRDHKCV